MKHFQVARTISQIMKCAPRPRSHEKARCEIYPRTELKRPVLDDEKVTWDVKYEDYAPINYTSASILAGPVYADPNYLDDESLLNEKPAKWNSIDGKIDRRSHHGPYAIVNNLPRNPVGRTGVIGRGMLGRWGPNHAADPIVTRWKRDPSGKKVTMPLGAKGGKPVLQFIAIQRRDSLEWAIPGGMVDPGENVSATLKREFSEEAMNYLEANAAERQEIRHNMQNLFAAGREIYKGYVDDPRNTDNAWMETVAVNFHDDTGLSVGKFKLHAGDDASGVKWYDVHSGIKLYASHFEFCRQVVDKHKAYW